MTGAALRGTRPRGWCAPIITSIRPWPGACRPHPGTPTSFPEILELVWWRLDGALDLEMIRVVGHAGRTRGSGLWHHRHRRSPRVAQRHRGLARRDRRRLRRGGSAGGVRLRGHRSPRCRRRPAWSRGEPALSRRGWSRAGRGACRLHLLRRDAGRSGGARRGVRGGGARPCRRRRRRSPEHPTVCAISLVTSGCWPTGSTWRETRACGEPSSTTRGPTSTTRSATPDPPGLPTGGAGHRWHRGRHARGVPSRLCPRSLGRRHRLAGTGMVVARGGKDLVPAAASGSGHVVVPAMEPWHLAYTHRGPADRVVVAEPGGPGRRRRDSGRSRRGSRQGGGAGGSVVRSSVRGGVHEAGAHPLPVPGAARACCVEWGTRHRILDLPSGRFHHVDPALDLSVGVGRRPAATPIGPAAGPHTQMAQNIVLGWLAGARTFELKTVQVLDELAIPRPCIDMEAEGYNVEWSQELRIPQSLEEYVKAWMMLRILGEWSELRPLVGRPGPARVRHVGRVRPGRHLLAGHDRVHRGDCSTLPPRSTGCVRRSLSRSPHGATPTSDRGW